MPLVRRSRLALVDHQVTLYGPDGRSGVYAVLFCDATKHGSVDVRYYSFDAKKQAHRPSRMGIVIGSRREVQGMIEALEALLGVWNEHGLKDQGVASEAASQA